MSFISQHPYSTCDLCACDVCASWVSAPASARGRGFGIVSWLCLIDGFPIKGTDVSEQFFFFSEQFGFCAILSQIVTKIWMLGYSQSLLMKCYCYSSLNVFLECKCSWVIDLVRFVLIKPVCSYTGAYCISSVTMLRYWLFSLSCSFFDY